MSTILENLIETYPNGYKDGEGWNMYELSYNVSITMNFIRNHIDGLMCKNKDGVLVLTGWNYSALMDRDDFDWSLLRDFPYIQWDINYASRMTTLDWSLIIEIPDRGWAFDVLSSKNVVDWKVIRQLHDKSWNFYSLSSNKDLDWSMVKDLPDKEWNFDILTGASIVDWKVVRDLIDKSWNFHHLSYKENVEWSVVKDFPDKDWNYRYLSERIDLPYSLVEALPHKFQGMIIRNAPLEFANLDELAVRTLCSLYLPGNVPGRQTKKALKG